MYEVILKRFEKPDEIRRFEKGKFEIVQMAGMTIGRATYSLDGNGPSTWAKPQVRRVAWSNTWAW